MGGSFLTGKARRLKKNLASPVWGLPLVLSVRGWCYACICVVAESVVSSEKW